MISIDYSTLTIFVPKNYMQVLQVSPTEILQLDTNVFRLDLKSLEASVNGQSFPDTHSHVQPISVGGVSLARVIEIINGFSVTFENGAYAVNLVGSNSNIADVVNVNNVSVRSSNSAGLTYSREVENLAFDDSRVYINTNGGGLPGSQYPQGTRSSPVDNIADAQTIIETRNLPKRIKLIGTLNISSSDNVNDYNFLGESVILSQINIATGASTQNLVVQDCQMTGDLNGNVTARRATSFTNLLDFDGALHGTGIGGTLTLQYNGRPHEFIDCYSEEGGLNTPIVDCQSMTNPEIYFRRYSGGLEIRNFTGGNMTIGGSDIRVLLHSSCTGGNIKLYGTMELVDNSNGSNVVVSGIVSNLVYQQTLKQYNKVNTIVAGKITSYNINNGDAIVDVSYDVNDIPESETLQ